MLTGILLFVLTQLPDREALIAYRNPIPSEVYTADSVLIGRYYVQDRRPVGYDEISRSVIEAAIATEDVRFFRHSGIDLRSLGRVLIKSILLQDESSGGGSTITQQLAKNIFPRKGYWVFPLTINKLREAFIAMRLEEVYSKKDILTLYLNTVPFGDNTYGIQSAARRFFSTNAGDIGPAQAAVLIGMLKATHSYNPRLFPENALSRRNIVLSQMAKYGFIKRKLLTRFQGQPLQLTIGSRRQEDPIAQYFKAYVRAELEKWCERTKKEDGSSYNLYTDGLRIYTTIDSKLQSYAEDAVRQQMAQLQEQFDQHWRGMDPWGENGDVVVDAVRRTRRYHSLREEGYDEADIMKEMSKPVSTELFTWSGPKEATMSALDSIRHHLRFLNAGFLVVHPSTGEIKAWVGGIDHGFFQYDHVRETTKRQVGSIFKPIVYANAIEQGISPCEFISAGQKTYIDEDGEEWTPRNSNFDYPVHYSLRGALAYSVNTVAVKLIDRAGIEGTVALAHDMGIHSEIPVVPSIALGSPAISLMEMTAAYSCFANGGVARFPVFIRAIRDRDGKMFADFDDNEPAKRVMSEESALLVRQMLQTVVHEGTASRLRWKYRVFNDVAAKTGTTQDNADGWFMAFTPNIVMGTWVGADDPRIRFRQTRLGEGSNTALPIVAYFLRAINDDPAYRDLAGAGFTPLPRELRRKLNCDLYELDDETWNEIEQSVLARDSIIMSDTLAPPPPETFLQSLYYRKKKLAVMSESSSTAVGSAGQAMN